MAGVPTIFDRAARRRRRNRAAHSGFLDVELYVADALVERLAMVARSFETALVVNSGAGTLASALRAKNMTVTEIDYGPSFAAKRAILHGEHETLAEFAGQFDLVVAPADFDTIDDLPGALIAARQALKPGGLFLGAMWGTPSLPALRGAMATAQHGGDRHVARFHPEIDVRSGGDLLARAGFVLSVADLETLTLSYVSLDRLFSDLRAAGTTNVLVKRYPLTRSLVDRARRAFAGMGGPDGRTVETVSLVMLTGWVP